jgi:hypothetical protein
MEALPLVVSAGPVVTRAPTSGTEENVFGVEEVSNFRVLDGVDDAAQGRQGEGAGESPQKGVQWEQYLLHWACIRCRPTLMPQPLNVSDEGPQPFSQSLAHRGSRSMRQARGM